VRPAPAVFSAALLFGAIAFACSYSTSDAPSGADAGPDAPEPARPTPKCESPKVPCAEVCVDTSSDPRNCGACGVTCSGATACVSAKCAPVGAYVVSRVYLGDESRQGGASVNAWRSFGENVDGKVSTPSSSDVCAPLPGASKSVHADGDNGIDNGWGSTVLPILAALTPSISKDVNARIAQGSAPLLLRFDGFSGELDLPSFGLAILDPAPLAAAKLDGTDRWPVYARSFDGLGRPAVAFPQSSLAAGALSTGPRGGPITLRLPGDGLDLDVPIGAVRVTARVQPKGLAQGTISGVIPVDAFAQSLRNAAARTSSSFCSGSTIEALLAQIRQAADILVDGSQDPAKACNGISIGIGFDAVPATIGETLKDPTPLPNPCL